MLVSYPYASRWLAQKKKSFYGRSWVLDSGAFTVLNSGGMINLDDYVQFCRGLSGDEKLKEVFSLDVIGDWRAGMENVQSMWGSGVRAIPTYHYGEPREVLEELSRRYPKIAVGGVARRLRGRKQLRFLEQCFSVVWPKLVHGFGVMRREVLCSLPFDSVDASNWEVASACFGSWKAYDGANLGIRGGLTPLQVEVAKHLELEEELECRWSGELSPLRTASGLDVK